ncbi:MAG: flagellar biosynthesis protein FlgG [Deltaproteobacteria bacterium]|nr:flagellar biosynthesis protein FlgG [Deltaproteobacteria bacterium]
MAISPAMYSSVTALDAFSTGTQVTAHNLANVLTDGFNAGRTVYQDLPRYSGTAAQTQTRLGPDGPLVPWQGLPRDPATPAWVPDGFVEGSNTDVAREMVNMIVTHRGYQANAKVIHVADSMMGTVIDLKV